MKTAAHHLADMVNEGQITPGRNDYGEPVYGWDAVVLFAQAYAKLAAEEQVALCLNSVTTKNGFSTDCIDFVAVLNCPRVELS